MSTLLFWGFIMRTYFQSDLSDLVYPDPLPSVDSMCCDSSFKSLPWITPMTLYLIPGGITYSEVTLLPLAICERIEADYLNFILYRDNFISLRNKFKKQFNISLTECYEHQITGDVIHLWRTLKKIEYKEYIRIAGVEPDVKDVLFGLPVRHQQLIYSILPDYDKIAYILYRKTRNLKARKARSKKFITRMFNNFSLERLFFITLTFTDDVLHSTSSDTRHAYVQRWLNENTLSYYANIDFGITNQREHYHAVVAIKSDFTEWQYGFSKIDHVRCSEDDCSRLASYINKLTNHANKLTCGKCFHSKEKKL